MFGGFAISIILGIAPIVVVGLLIYLIYKRLKDKDKEEFEKRDY